ncbi:ABC transporter permease [Piscibacillus halophilus]|uniref:ABC transporter permease n=1 Tax=Piscibacillus halophilus TaxID=571933 RepID=UPI0024094C67|nr:ABC transporter permease [Piscibacillus halophilus]
MFPKALWMKEWKHTKIISFALLVVYILAYPVAAGLSIDSWKARQNSLHWSEQSIYEIQSLFSGELYAVIGVIVIVLLAGFLIGLEKNTKRYDFMMALPFSRTQMFLTKYFYGLIVIGSTYAISFLSGYLVIVQSEFSYLLSEINMLYAFFSPLAMYFVIFSLAMLVGTITGEVKSQTVLSFIFLIYPQALFVLIASMVDLHGGDPGSVYNDNFIMEDMFWFSYLNIGTDQNVLIPLIFGLIFTGLAWFAFIRSSSEYCGEFLMFSQLHPLFAILIPISGALLGGFIVGGVVPYDAGQGLKMMVYWIGFIIALFFAFKITKRLLNR